MQCKNRGIWSDAAIIPSACCTSLWGNLVWSKFRNVMCPKNVIGWLPEYTEWQGYSTNGCFFLVVQGMRHLFHIIHNENSYYELVTIGPNPIENYWNVKGEDFFLWSDSLQVLSKKCNIWTENEFCVITESCANNATANVCSNQS